MTAIHSQTLGYINTSCTCFGSCSCGHPPALQSSCTGFGVDSSFWDGMSMQAALGKDKGSLRHPKTWFWMDGTLLDEPPTEDEINGLLLQRMNGNIAFSGATYSPMTSSTITVTWSNTHT